MPEILMNKEYNIYNEFGVQTEYNHAIDELGEEVMRLFSKRFPKESISLPSYRMLFHEFLFELNCNFAEDLILRQTVLRGIIDRTDKVIEIINDGTFEEGL